MSYGSLMAPLALPSKESFISGMLGVLLGVVRNERRYLVFAVLLENENDSMTPIYS